jgi:hypothetical protein|tara:strand:+ start:2435 stop:3346 length:912 start_codon:yes stop_codon:yes gene_type:complete
MTTHFNNGVTNVVKDKSPLKNAMMPDPFPVTSTQGGGYDFLGQTSFMDDFYSFITRTNTSNNGRGSPGWYVSQTASTQTVQPDADAHGGWLQLDEVNATNDAYNQVNTFTAFQLSTKMNSGFECRIAVEDVSTTEIVIGLADTDVTSGVVDITDGVYFSNFADPTSITAGTGWYLHAEKNGTVTSSSALVDPYTGDTFVIEDGSLQAASATQLATPSNSFVFGFNIVPQGSNGNVNTSVIQSYLGPVGKQPLATESIVTTNLPDDLVLGIMMGTKNNTTTASIMWVDYIKMISSRSFGSSTTK